MGVFEVALALYALAAVAYAGLVFAKDRENDRLPAFFARFGWMVHSVGLMGHAPATGIFEALLFFAWAVMAAQIFMEQRLEWRGTGLFSASLVAVAILIASLSTQSAPLNPALQSRWLWLHVTAGALSYAFFLLSAFASVFYLIRKKIRTDLVLAAISLFGVMALSTLFGPLQALLPGSATYGVLLIALAGFSVHVSVIALSLALERLAAGAQKNAARIAAEREKRGLRILKVAPLRSPRRWLGNASRWVFASAWAMLLALAGFLFVQLYSNRLTATAGAPEGSFYFSVLMFLAWMGAFALVLVPFRERVENRLPSAERLDLWSFQSALYGFPLLTINLVSGSVWAYDAWGSAWSWESKTIWAVITWLFYAVYLRLRRGEKKTALVALFGFFVIAMTFLSNSGRHFFLK